MKAIRKQRAYGRYVPPLMDAEPVREKLRQLAEIGITHGQVAVALGWEQHALGRVTGLSGQRTAMIRRDRGEAVLAFQPSQAADAMLVPSVGLGRRIHALNARGWSIRKLAAELGLNEKTVRGWMTRGRVPLSVHRQVDALFRRLWDKTPPVATRADRISYKKALAAAKSAGWLPPLAWDDIDNDPEPPAIEDDEPADEAPVDDVLVELALSGRRVRLNPAEKREVVRRAHDRHWSDLRVARETGMNPRTVLRIRQELNLPAWAYSELEKAA
jgi:AraC-like DNA-binding protein